MQNQITRDVRATVVLLSCVISATALYVKLYFWGGTQYASLTTKLGFWFVILAGPSAALVLRKSSPIALVFVASQLLLLVLASF